MRRGGHVTGSDGHVTGYDATDAFVLGQAVTSQDETVVTTQDNKVTSPVQITGATILDKMVTSQDNTVKSQKKLLVLQGSRV
eukprot:2395805-Rhodomonas_salina.1